MSIVINRHNVISYRYFASYIGNNLYYYFNDETRTKLVDTNIVNIDCDFSGISFNLEEFDVKSKKDNAICVMYVNSGTFDMEYKLPDTSEDETLKYTVSVNSYKDKTIYNPIEDKPMISIEFKCKNEYSLSNFNKFTKYIHKFVKHNIDKMQTNDEDITIYCNDDAYWDELQTKSTRPIDTVYLPKDIKNTMINDLEWFLDNITKKKYKTLGRTHKRVYLFEGIPGSGKTTFISGLAAKFGYNLAMINFTNKVTDGSLIRLIRTLPEKTFLVLEDIDCLFEERKKNDGHKNTVTFSGILNSLDGIATPDNFICFMTTNYKCNIDSALLRPGRIDKIIKFEHAKRIQIKDIFKAYMDEQYNDEHFENFYKGYQDLNIKAPVALIQEFLFKYIDSPLEAIKNIDEMKDIYDSSFKTSVDMYM